MNKISPEPPSSNLHIVCHQHFDLIWRRPVPWYAKRRETIYLAVLAMLERYPEATFNFNQTLPFREFLAQHPECRDRVAALLQQRRLEITGGTESIPDLNLTGAAPLLRNIASGLQFWRDEFGYRVRGGSFSDVFGIPDTLPGIVAAHYEYFHSSRMPRPGRPDVGGDFRLTGSDGVTIRCIAPDADFSLWGWGTPQNPDEKKGYSTRERAAVIRESLRRAASLCRKKEHLFVFSGEEQIPPANLPELVATVAGEFPEVNFRFSTPDGYFDALDAGYWQTTPEYRMPEEDFSRLFTGCYASRTASKRQPKILEDLIAGARMAGQEARISPEDWKTLFLAQFHDAICGCHTPVSARWLQRQSALAQARLQPLPRRVPWARRLPDFDRLPAGNGDAATAGTLVCGDWRIAISAAGKLESLSWRGKPVMPPEVVLREEHGTLWTEEYSGRQLTILLTELPLSVGVADAETVRIAAAWNSGGRFLDKWTGFGRFAFTLELQFRRDCPGMLVRVTGELVGNSVELALRYRAGHELDTVEAGQPLGSRRRTAYAAGPIQGHAFPAYEWVDADEFAVFHHATPAWALREGGLENILLRSPVKRWSPWFPVTPTLDAQENERREFRQLFWPGSAELSSGERFRLAREFQMAQLGPYESGEAESFRDLPDHLALLDWDGGNRAVLFELDGRTATWRGIEFPPRQLRHVTLETTVS